MSKNKSQAELQAKAIATAQREQGLSLARQLKDEFRSFPGMRSYLLGVDADYKERITTLRAEGDNELADNLEANPKIKPEVIELLKMSRNPLNYRYIQTVDKLATEQCDKIPLTNADGHLLCEDGELFYTPEDVALGLADKPTAKSKLGYVIQDGWTEYKEEGGEKLRDENGNWIKRRDYANKYERYPWSKEDALKDGEHCRYVYSLSKFLAWAYVGTNVKLVTFRDNLEKYKLHSKEVKAEKKAEAKAKATTKTKRKRKAPAKAEKVEA